MYGVDNARVVKKAIRYSVRRANWIVFRLGVWKVAARAARHDAHARAVIRSRSTNRRRLATADSHMIGSAANRETLRYQGETREIPDDRLLSFSLEKRTDSLPVKSPRIRGFLTSTGDGPFLRNTEKGLDEGDGRGEGFLCCETLRASRDR